MTQPQTKHEAPIDARATDLLDFWFGDLRERYDAKESLRRWFSGDPELDALCRERFGALLSEAEAGGLRDWEGRPESLLALVILLDQLSRNLHRGSAAAFANDARACNLAHQAVDSGWDLELHPLERLFLYLPFEHSESLADQDLAVERFAALEAVAGPELQAAVAGYSDYARRHRDVIVRFGRFPHRNQRLGRPSTPEEQVFLTQPGSSFG